MERKSNNDELMDGEEHKVLSFSRDQGFFEKSAAIRYLIGIIFAVTVFCTLHFIEVRVDMPEIGSESNKFIASRINFEFLDEEASQALKEESTRDIGIIYKLDEDQVRDVRVEFQKYLMQNSDWRKFAELSTFEEMYEAGNLLEICMLEGRFTDGRTLQKMKETLYPYHKYQIFIHTTNKSDAISLPDRLWKHLSQSAFSKHTLQKSTIEFITTYFKKKRWFLKEDYASRNQFKTHVKKYIPNIYTKVKRGSRIIGTKERVTPRHIMMLQEMKKSLRKSRNISSLKNIVGSFLMSMLFTILGAFYLRRNHANLFFSNRKLSLLVSIIALTIIIAKFLEFTLLNTSHLILDKVRLPLVVPFTGVLICSLLNSRVAFVACGFTAILLMTSLVSKTNGFAIVNIFASFATILSTRSLRKRKEIFVVCIKGWIATTLVLISLNFKHPSFAATLFLYDVICSLVFMLCTAILVTGLLAVFESIFGIMTDITLMEYMDPNHPLLRRLSIEAPGTYQHSLVVGSLSETAAVSIGANGLFCRVSTLYHDIGKLVTPQYFTENQLVDVDIHQLLTPKESAQVIIAHVSEGVTMARKAGLPEQFIDIIKEHHGTTLMWYFYHKYCEEKGEKVARKEIENFRYSGPKPRSKESAIVMIADSVEAASRSLDNFSEESVSELVGRLIREKSEDGQFDACCLTFEELGMVKESMIKTLVAAGHSRIRYPKREF